MKIDTALITACGFGTRWLPETKSIQKAMLPVLSRPVIDYNLQDCIKAGIKHIIVAVSPDHDQIQQYLQPPRSLEIHLKDHGKLEANRHYLDEFEGIKFTFININENLPYGTYNTVLSAKKYLEKLDAFVVFVGDDFIYNQDGSSEAAKLIGLMNTNVDVVLDAATKPKEELNRYGVLSVDSKGFLKTFVEKPKLGEEPSNLINISKYVFSSKIYDAIDEAYGKTSNYEYVLVEAIQLLADKHRVMVMESQGEYLDGGTIPNWLKANLALAWEDPELRKLICEFVNKNK